MSLVAIDDHAAVLRRAALLLESGQFDSAEALYGEVLRNDPNNALAHTLAAMTHVARGEREAALASFDRALAIQPGLVPVAQARADLCRQLGGLDQSIAGYTHLLDASPDDPAALLGRAAALLGVRRHEAALVDYDRAVALDPRSADAHNGRGVALRALRQYEAALQAFAAALHRQPSLASAANNFGLTLHDLGRSEEAIEHLRRALSEHPQRKSCLHNLAMILHSIDRHDEAAQYYGRLVAMAPDFDYAAGNLARSRIACCDWSCLEEDIRRIVESHSRGTPAADAMTSLMVTDSAELKLECARRFAAREYPANSPLWCGERYQHDRIRVAYLSADFHDHPVAHLLAGVLERHDRQRFETFGLSLRRETPAGAMHARVHRAFEHFDDVADVDDREVAVRLRQREVDIAVDLTGFTRGGRLGILASRPAPVQVNFLGFAGTYGAPYVDYLIADRVVVPAGEESHYCERIVRLPHVVLPNDDRQPVAQGMRRRDFGLPDDGFVYCAFSNSYKITPRMFEMWMRLLRAEPKSVMWLRAGPAAANLAHAALTHGIAAERLVFAPRVPEMDRHLGRYRLADLFLDTWPYGAHATARDALWAGLPLLTLAGASFASRVAASLLKALDLPELVADDHESYFRMARALTLDPTRLAEKRRHVAARRLAAAPFGSDLYRRHLEAAFRCMWERQQRGETPADIDVPEEA